MEDLLARFKKLQAELETSDPVQLKESLQTFELLLLDIEAYLDQNPGLAESRLRKVETALQQRLEELESL